MPVVPLPSVYEVGGPFTAAAKGPSFLHPASRLPIPPSVIEDLSTRLGDLEYGHGQLVKKVIQVSDSEVAADWHPGGARSADSDLERRCDCWTDSAGAGLAGSSVAEGFANSAAAYYSI
ncbi:hypothetical protein Tco_1138474 [Tanacetum coccineum]